MAEYDPKRRRRNPPAEDDGPAAVDALLEAVEHLPSTASEATGPPSAEPAPTDVAAPGERAAPQGPGRTTPPRMAPGRDISPVPAAAPGTGARSLVIVAAAAAAGAIVTLLVVVRLLGRRRRHR